MPGAHYHLLTPIYETIARPFIGKVWKGVAEEVVKHAPQGSSISDLACGPGTVLRLVREQRPDIILEGIDIDPKMVSMAEKKAGNMGITFQQASIDALPIPDHSRGTVLCSMSFHHLPLTLKRAAIREVKRILKPEGAFYLCDFSVPSNNPQLYRSSFKARLMTCFTRLVEPDVIPQFEGQLLALAREAGASIETPRTFGRGISLHLLKFPEAT